ncbi:HNH endonuclease family protein [Miltoncostaea oceani]|uniref:HNH endonuclease family protein n=1 Tax=Miltoncostaea oceani TaxID=2843216 RepID=UPI001C3CF2A3|nr:HNH endonuclease family protein [Miltoncostaea oceani]
MRLRTARIRNRSIGLIQSALLVAAFVWAAGTGLVGGLIDRLDAHPAVSVAARADSQQIAAARAHLNHVSVRPDGSMRGYDRDLFRHWSDPDGNGCDAREDTLRRDGRALKPPRACRPNTGRWRDPYSGELHTRARLLDVDHIVPLAEAWRSGAARWSAAKRERFANDPRNLLAVDRGLNRSKGDKGPEAWLPPARNFHPTYAVRWVQIKKAYGLRISFSERSALRAALRNR